ncbi:tyrosine-type recombinase/integrase [Caldinitratiruptor microaerophilus]|uniref:Site-specific integrase n=1 Tax=Caldinitratiruptor microaerophilus TaxID=671077 RepID=A0AA35CK06_9FIRM|nr:site-specific integrase [Caldinitratiruptor microaerophilus]BDG59904.1 site-specific integrase [Caldinitratiruptor microaerophilus]
MRGQLIQRGEKTWLLRVYLGEVNGKRQYKAKTVHGLTKKQAEAELRNWVREIEAGGYVEPSKVLVGELLDRWLRDWAEQRVSKTTLLRYRWAADKHIKPALGYLPLSKVNTLTINDFYAELREQGKAPATLRIVHAVLNQAMAAAVRWKLITSNPAAGADLPRVQRRQVQALTPDQAARLLEAAEGTDLYIPVLLGLTTGMRVGEICALRWDDLDFTTGTISIRHTQAVDENRRVYLKVVKTKSSARRVDLSPEVVRALREHKARQNELRLQAGPNWQDHGLVFCRADGSPEDRSNVNKRLKTLMRRAGLPVLSSHKAWRHTAASVMLAEGVHPKVVQERLGHSSISMTLDLYSHLAPGMQKAAAEKVEAALFARRKPGSVR